jgi:hypothetical protein
LGLEIEKWTAGFQAFAAEIVGRMPEIQPPPLKTSRPRLKFSGESLKFSHAFLNLSGGWLKFSQMCGKRLEFQLNGPRQRRSAGNRV